VEYTITRQNEHELQVHLRARTYAFFVHLNGVDEQTRISDNYFDMDADEERTITLVNQARALTPELVSVAWR
jgi:beta-mannosidase